MQQATACFHFRGIQRCCLWAVGRLGDAACLVCVAVAVDWQAQRSCLSGVAVCIKGSNCKTVNTLWTAHMTKPKLLHQTPRDEDDLSATVRTLPDGLEAQFTPPDTTTTCRVLRALSIGLDKPARWNRAVDRAWRSLDGRLSELGGTIANFVDRRRSSLSRSDRLLVSN